mmetsp:Transcript_19403/g.65773  ORF Transcript_19403/g.65773 Transcript_19403/m.65773 type:complete len:214 (+) Transcript_19403:205-846(+)
MRAAAAPDAEAASALYPRRLCRGRRSCLGGLVHGPPKQVLLQSPLVRLHGQPRSHEHHAAHAPERQALGDGVAARHAGAGGVHVEDEGPQAAAHVVHGVEATDKRTPRFRGGHVEKHRANVGPVDGRECPAHGGQPGGSRTNRGATLRGGRGEHPAGEQQPQRHRSGRRRGAHEDGQQRRPARVGSTAEHGAPDAAHGGPCSKGRHESRGGLH